MERTSDARGAVRTEAPRHCTILLERSLGARKLAQEQMTGCTFLLVDDQLEELRALITRHAAGADVAIDGVVSTAIDGVFVSSVTGNAEATAPTSGTLLAVIAQGGKRLAVGERVYEYRAGQYLVASVDLPIAGSHWYATATEPALGFGLVLDPAAIASLVLDAETHEMPATPRRASSAAAPPALGVADASPELLDAVIRMLRLLDSPGDRHVLAPMTEREILWRLIVGPVGETVRQIGLAGSSLAHVSRAVRRITERYDEPFLVEELARACAMSTSAFHRNFQAVTGFSPIQFQKKVRLQRSRLLLMSGADDVATVGYRVGYDSAPQFSRDYRREFGMPPGRDAVRLRAAATVT
jgi:AraC-like DNA-binding protein